VHVVIDDLGAGYSNLRYIADLHPSLVKLDRALVRGRRNHSRMFRLVEGIVVLCGSLDARVVAEGIETEAELALVREAGVHFGQGYLLAKPAFPAPEVRWPYEHDEHGDGPGVAAAGWEPSSRVRVIAPFDDAAES
jgi:EAL domain-containing protein (putative c-di-GMP-specific phosphodiesterase class I)